MSLHMFCTNNNLIAKVRFSLVEMFNVGNEFMVGISCFLYGMRTVECRMNLVFQNMTIAVWSLVITTMQLGCLKLMSVFG